MISLHVFLIGLLLTSTLTGLATEAVKNIMMEHNISYRANTLAGIVSLFISAIVGIGYIVITGIPFTSQIIVCLIAQVFMSWLCSMVGYDKVMQAIGQFTTKENEEE